MMRKAARSNLLDKLHRGTVWVCIGVTLASSVVIAERAYYYFTHTRPANRKRLEEFQSELLKEGTSDTLFVKDLTQELKA